MYRFVPQVLVVAFAAWCLFVLRGDLAQVSVASVLRSWDLLIVAAVLSLINYALRIFRWRLYLARLGHPLPLQFTALTFVAGFAYTLSPGKVGEMVRARYYIPWGVGLSRVAAVFFAERLLDLVSIAVLAALVFAGSPQYGAVIYSATALVLVALGALALSPWERVSEAARSADYIPGFMRGPLVKFTATLAGTRPLLRPAPLAVGLAVGLLAWGLEGTGFGVLSGMFPAEHLAVPTAVGIYAAAALIGGLSFLPGGLGSTEAVMTTLLVAHHFSIGDAILVTLACRLVTLWWGVGLGWMCVLMLRRRTFAMASPWP